LHITIGCPPATLSRSVILELNNGQNAIDASKKTPPRKTRIRDIKKLPCDSTDDTEADRP